MIRDKAQRLHDLAHFDVLTGLPNRLLLADRLDHAMARSLRESSNLAVCFVDLDGFKPINDTFGHDVGDMLLVAVADRLKPVPRETDTVARLGGDEFVVLLNDVGDEQSCRGAIERILAELAKPFHVAGQQMQVTASIGVRLCNGDDTNAETLMRDADQAMYRAKVKGRNCWLMFPVAETLAVDCDSNDPERVAGSQQ